jgi:predicted nucleotidyltransferase
MVSNGGLLVAADFEAVVEEARRFAAEAGRLLPVAMAYLLGSHAKGCADELSDVDVAFFVRDCAGATRFDAGVRLLGLCRGYRAYFEPLVFETSEIGRDNPFVNEILRTGVRVAPAP